MTKTNKLNKRKIEEQDNTNKSFKIFKKSELIGENPHHMIQLLYDKKNKTPLTYSLDLKRNGIHIFNIFKNRVSSNKFEYIDDNYHILLYGYQFIETSYEHELVICNHSIAKDALEECEKQNLSPYNMFESYSNTSDNTSDNCSDNSSGNTLSQYDNIIKKGKNGKLSLNDINNKEFFANIHTNIITYYFINEIICKNKSEKNIIKIMNCNVTNIEVITNIEDIMQKMIFEAINQLINR